ncbi:hypothetical protein [Vibrio cholerae]|uniref:hypothetical protein n=1 Tax=Vibrio cholerae TaxID=666 RepID=UPI000AEA5F70|nr:hypothetical protein [Vibrio cholerae]EJL6615467.1 hypothetical protein [Vibrio cholerae]
MQLEVSYELYREFMKKANANGYNVKRQIIELMKDFVKEESQGEDIKAEGKENARQ